jgi:hypothetical protein
MEACRCQAAANKIPERKEQIKMIIAEWSGKRVTLYTDTKIQFRQINVPHNVVGVQVSGDSRTDAMVSIAMDNGRTWLYKSSGTLVRQ